MSQNSFEDLMMARFDRMAQDKKINISINTPPPPDELPSGGSLVRGLTKRLASESTGNVQQSNLVKLFSQPQDELAGTKNLEMQLDKFDAPFVADQAARTKFDKMCKYIGDHFNQEVPAASYDKKENTAVTVLLQSTRLIQKDIKELNVQLLNRKSGQASQSEFPNKLREVRELTPKDSGDLQVQENVQDEEEDKNEITFVPLHFQKRNKVAFEEAPLKMRIESIAKLTVSTPVFAGQEALGKVGFPYQSTQALLAPDEKIRQNILGQLKDTQFDDLQANSFVESVFQDQIQIDNFFTARKNLTLMQAPDSESLVQFKRQQVTRMPTADSYSLPQDSLDIDLFRDLGPLMRQKNLQYDKVQRSYLNEISEETSPEELMLLVLAGVCPIEKIPQFNQNIPEMPRSRLDDCLSKKESSKYFKQNNESLEEDNIKKPAKSAPLPEHDEDFATESESSDITEEIETESISNSDFNSSASDSSSSLKLHEEMVGGRYRESVMINNVLFQIEQAQNAQPSESSSETAKEEEPVGQLTVNASTAKLKQKIVNELVSKKDTTSDSSQPSSPVVNKLAAVASESKEMKAAREKARLVDTLTRKIQKQEELLNKVWSDIMKTKQERGQVLKQKELQEKKQKELLERKETKSSKNHSVGDNSSSLIKRLNSKLEQELLQAIKGFDSIFEMNSQLRDMGQPSVPQLPLLLQRAATIEAEEEIDEQTKGQFLFRIVKEIRRSIETQNKQRLEREKRNQIKSKIRKMMPQLSPSPSPSPEKNRKSHSPSPEKVKKNDSKASQKKGVSSQRKENEGEIRPMSRGYGVSVSYRKTQPNNFSYSSRSKPAPQANKEEYVSIMSQSNAHKGRAKPNHFKAPKIVQDVAVQDDWFSNEPDQDVWI